MENPPERGTLYRLEVYERAAVRHFTVKVYERVGSSVISVVRRPERVNLDAFYDREKVDKTFRSWFFVLFILHTVPLQQLKLMQSSKLGI